VPTTTSTPPDVGIAAGDDYRDCPDRRRSRSDRCARSWLRPIRSAQAWAAYAGTLQALGVAGSFGGLSVDQLAVLELRAAPGLVEAAASISCVLAGRAGTGT
jgi:hypothetical protein